jgi:hypothetical protein
METSNLSIHLAPPVTLINHVPCIELILNETNETTKAIHKPKSSAMAAEVMTAPFRVGTKELYLYISSLSSTPPFLTLL